MRTSILLVTHNGAAFLPELAASLLPLPADTELVVVDNASRDGTADEVLRLMPEARLIRSDRNLGFCAGNNLAATNATGEFLILLNQDTVVRPGWIAALTGALEADATIGVAQSKVLLYRDPSLLNAVGCGVNYLFFGWADRNGQVDDVHGAPFEVPYAMGAALCIRKSLYERLGGFDEPFFMYHDDLELGLKARLSGLRCVCVPDSVVLHKYNDIPVPAKLYYMERNRHLMLQHYYGRRTRAVLWPLHALIDLGVLLTSIPQGWSRECRRARRDARRMRKKTRGPDPAHPYRDRDLIAMLGPRFEAGTAAPSRAQRVARVLIRAYYPVARRFAR